MVLCLPRPCTKARSTIDHADFENDSTPSHTVAAQYRAATDEQDATRFLMILRWRGGDTEFSLAKDYCVSDDPIDRCVGAEILGQIGYPAGGTFIDESLELLIPMLADTDPLVIAEAAHALGMRHDPRVIPHLVAIADHPDSGVRYGVTHGLQCHEDQEAIRTLITLSNDPDPDIRDWALFGLGTQIDTNTPAIREALFRGLNEEDDEARGEALVGLARCGDERVVAALLDEWAEPPIGSLSLEAAAAIGDCRLLPRLYRQREIWLGKGDVEEPFRTLLSDAIAACEPD